LSCHHHLRLVDSDSQIGKQSGKPARWGLPSRINNISSTAFLSFSVSPLYSEQAINQCHRHPICSQFQIQMVSKIIPQKAKILGAQQDGRKNWKKDAFNCRVQNDGITP
jgi:hypothetical protein